ncbi:DUF6399 domain-containing protein [Methylomonas sp. AM2-LC]|uniref:DUF6399 domain-containing protein n=1 Tax=Methylomonas sp. AM2-LC TaxID=3153301 RepID=UPI003263BA83
MTYLVRYINDQKNNTTQKLRTTSRLIIDEIARSGKQSVRKLAALVNRSKSSVYRHQQTQALRNQHPEAAQHLQADAFTATLPESELQRWLEWAEWIARNFHRSSSAVEGRNGYLSQMYHNGRGLTEKRLRALTVIHNYGLKRSDGTTAAMRLFGRDFPDLFSWLVDEMGETSAAKKRKRTGYS